MQEILRKCDDFAQKTGFERPGFAITGGDPVLSPDFRGLMDLLKVRGDDFVMMGNPFHLTEETLAIMKESGCTAYQVSIDGLEKTHDHFRKPGSFRATMDCIPKICAAGIKAHVMMTISELNCAQLPDVMEAVSDAGADVFAFARYVPTSSDKHLDLTPLSYRDVLDTYVKKRRQLFVDGSFTEFALKDPLFTLYYYEEGKIKIPPYEHTPGQPMPAGCSCARQHLDISADGTVYACRRSAESALGNIFRDDLEEMWEKAQETYLQYEKIEGCNCCALAPWCRGCPAVASGTSGSFFARDPQCWKIVEVR